MDIKYTKIFEGSYISCNRLVNELKSVNIYPIVKDHSRSALLSGFGFNPNEKTKIFVRTDQTFESKEIINKLGI